jgi:acetyl-CoA acyltransferase
MKDSYIVTGLRTAVGKAPRGSFRFTRPDDLAIDLLKQLLAKLPQLDKEMIDDVIVGNATPEAEQGLNIGRMISLMGLDTWKVPGMTVNRYCSSGLETIAIADAKIKSGMADCIVAGGVESMSFIPFGGWKIVPNYEIAKTHGDYYWGMGLTAEAVAKEFNITRDEQDWFAFSSHQKALKAIKEEKFKDEIAPITIKEVYLDENEKKKTREYVVAIDEGPRPDTSLEALSKLKPVFHAQGTVTAGNSSQTSDGAAFVVLMSGEMVKSLNITPLARLVSYAVAGVEPRIMGIGPVEAVPKVLKQANLKLEDIDLIELNEAFAAQTLAVIKKLNLDDKKVNVNGGAIALGHPLGCTGAKLTVQIIHELVKNKQKYGLVTMCVGTGQGAAGIIEVF